jgi:hypothetical protein
LVTLTLPQGKEKKTVALGPLFGFAGTSREKRPGDCGFAVGAFSSARSGPLEHRLSQWDRYQGVTDTKVQWIRPQGCSFMERERGCFMNVSSTATAMKVIRQGDHLRVLKTLLANGFQFVVYAIYGASSGVEQTREESAVLSIRSKQGERPWQAKI